jgi:hypothetical protein
MWAGAFPGFKGDVEKKIKHFRKGEKRWMTVQERRSDLPRVNMKDFLSLTVSLETV